MKIQTTSSKMKTSEKIIRAKKEFVGGWVGMCVSFDGDYPILFNYYIAVLFFGAKLGCKYRHWWPTSDKESRLKYFDWMIRIYKLFGR